ncbi:MAG: RAD52 family DNA repair protein [Chloroflexi bacterium]|nr:RAD52 family DNA repair protein [Chloroflexota bacterium]MDE2710109.1 RAD52 family DNA repair protein [Chloroflexota bacterium]
MNHNGNGTATAVRRSPNGRAPTQSTNGNGNGSHAQRNQPTSVGHNPAPPAPEALHWDALAPRVTEALAQPLDPQLVSQRKGRKGRMFDYIEGHTAIDQANKIFGFGGWGYELVGDVTLRRIERIDSRTGEVTGSDAYSAIVRVTVPGAPARTDVGFQPVTDETPEGHETAYKGAVTDALKRALRSFGDRFGNGLYGDPPTTARNDRAPEPHREPRPQPAAERSPTQQSRRRVVRPEAPTADDQDARNLRGQLIELSTEQGFTEEQVRSAVQAKTGRTLDELGPAELNPLIASAADKLEQRRQAEQG